MSSLPRVTSINSLNNSVSNMNLLELNKCVSKESLLESVLKPVNGLESNVRLFSKQKIFKDKEWQAPSQSGLRNSEPIIPSYYLKKIIGLLDEYGEPVEYMNIDYVTIIKDDIRNLRKLNKYQIRYIKIHLDNTEKNEIIDEFINASNNCIDNINDL